MQGRTGRAAALPACAIFLAVGSALGAPAAASTPPLLWQDVSAIGVQCLVQSDARGHEAALGASLCERTRQIASRAAPAPIKIIPLGDPALIARGTVSLLVHASIQSSPEGRMMAFSIRPLGASAESAILFGSAPRIVALGGPGIESPALDAALAGALAEILPWQARPKVPRPLPKSL